MVLLECLPYSLGIEPWHTDIGLVAQYHFQRRAVWLTLAHVNKPKNTFLGLFFFYFYFGFKVLFVVGAICNERDRLEYVFVDVYP